LRADRHSAAVSGDREPVRLDERDDRPGQGEEFLRDPGHRVPDRRRPRLGLTPSPAWGRFRVFLHRPHAAARTETWTLISRTPGGVVAAADYRTDAVLTLDRRDCRVLRPLTPHAAFRLLPEDRS